MHSLELVTLRNFGLVEADEGGPLDKELSHKKIERAAVEVTRVVGNVQVVDLRELEDLEGDLERFNGVMTKVKVLEFRKFWELIFDGCNLVSSQMEAFECWKARLPAGKRDDQVVGEIKFLKLRKRLEVREVLELVVNG